MNFRDQNLARGVGIFAALTAIILVAWVMYAHPRTVCGSNLAEVYRSMLLFYSGGTPPLPKPFEDLTPEEFQDFLIKNCSLRGRKKCPSGRLVSVRRVTSEDANHPQPYCDYHRLYYTELKGVRPAPTPESNSQLNFSPRTAADH